MKHFLKYLSNSLIRLSSRSQSKAFWTIIVFLQISVTGFSQTGIGLDCNQPIDPVTGAIQPNATYAVVGTTCTPWVRLNFILGPWSSPSDQTLHSGKTWKQTYDEIVNGFINQGIQVYGLISDQAYSNPGDLLQLVTPNNQAATDAWISQYVANFVDIVGYFRTRVTTYESYNEPNNWNNGMAVVHSKWFAKILQEVYMETKYYNGHDSDPSWQVTLVSGPIFTHASDDGASYISSTYSYGINNFDWTWILNNKGTYPLDGFGMHIYTTQGDSDPAVVVPGMNTNINAFWNSIVNYEGSTSKKIWVSEFGWESNAVGYQGQADNLTTGFNLLKNDSRIALAIFFSLSDWPGASWGLYEFGNFAPSDQKLSFNAFKNQVSCPASPSPTNLQVTSDCSGAVNFNWTNSGSGWFVDVSTDPNYGTFSNKDISNLTSTTAPSGFSPSITFLPGTTYYWHIWNGSTHTDGNSFTIPTCVSPTNLQVTTDCLGNVNFNWTNTGTGWFVDVSTDAGFATYSNKDVSNLTSINPPSGFSPAFTFLPNTTYYWRVWNGFTHTNGNSFIFQACITPANLQVFIGCSGDVAFNWSNSGSDWMIDVSSDPNFSFYYNKSVSNQTSTIAPSGFACDIGFAPCTPGSLSFQPNVTYYWRIWNGTTHTSGNSFTVPPALPAPIITANGATSFCQGGNVTLDAGAGYTSYSWSNGATSQTINVTGSNSYSVTITNSNGCLASSASTTVTVNSLPAAPIITPSGVTTFCQGGSVILDAGGGYFTYSWSNGATSQTINVTSSNNYSVTIADGNGCLASSALTTVTVNSLPTAPTITAGGATTFCQGGSVTLDAGVGYSTYLWSNGASSQTINVISSDNYSVTITDGNGCSASSSITTVTVNPLPAIPTITQNGNVLSSSAATGNQWYLNGSVINNEILQNYTITQIGNYSLTVTDMNGCSSTSVTLSIITTDIKSESSSIDELEALSVYPNPNNGAFTLRFNLLYIPIKITILNLLGEQIYFAYTTNNTGEFTINLPVDNTGIVSQGIYFIQVMAESKMYNLKVVRTE